MENAEAFIRDHRTESVPVLALRGLPSRDFAIRAAFRWSNAPAKRPHAIRWRSFATICPQVGGW